MAASRNRKLVVGLIGQVCAGKSTVAEAFKRQGAMVFDADRTVHELYGRAEVAGQLRRLFGESVLDREGRVSRKELARLVFSDPAQLKRLTEEVVFPRVKESLEVELERFRSSESAVLLLDAPTLVEAGRTGLCNQVVFVSAPLSRRQQWARERGWEADELDRREACMLDEEQKRRVATASINNDGTREDIEVQIRKLLAAWGVLCPVASDRELTVSGQEPRARN